MSSWNIIHVLCSDIWIFKALLVFPTSTHHICAWRPHVLLQLMKDFMVYFFASTWMCKVFGVRLVASFDLLSLLKCCVCIPCSPLKWSKDFTLIRNPGRERESMNIYLKIHLLCPQVHCMALIQGVQEGGEMSGPPLPREERQQFETGFYWPRHLKIPKSLGLFLFLFFVHPVGCGEETIHPNHKRRPTWAPPESTLSFPPYKSTKDVSRI